jgi:hypothetical protein
MDRRARRSFCFQGCDEACRVFTCLHSRAAKAGTLARGCPVRRIYNFGYSTEISSPRRRECCKIGAALASRECGPDLLSPSPDTLRRLGPTLSKANCGRIPSEIVAVGRRLTDSAGQKLAYFEDVFGQIKIAPTV